MTLPRPVERPNITSAFLLTEALRDPALPG